MVQPVAPPSSVAAVGLVGAGGGTVRRRKGDGDVNAAEVGRVVEAAVIGYEITE
jgi:MYXO-CTERM domain-containing protein